MGRLICTWMDWEDDRAEGSLAVLIDTLEKQYPYIDPEEYFWVDPETLFDNPEEAKSYVED